MAIEVLEPEENFVHAYYHDLESLFYVLCWICSVQGGPANTRRNFDYMESEIRRWTAFDDSETSLCSAMYAKMAIMPSKKRFEREVSKRFDDYFKPIIPCIEKLRNLLFSCIRRDDGESILVKQQLLTSALNATPRNEEFVHILMEELPVRVRDPDTVCQSFVDIVEEGIKNLPEEHKRIPWVASVLPVGMKEALDIELCPPLDVVGVVDKRVDDNTKGKNESEKDIPSRAVTRPLQQNSIAATGISGRSKGSKRSFAADEPEAQRVPPLRSPKRLRASQEPDASSTVPSKKPRGTERHKSASVGLRRSARLAASHRPSDQSSSDSSLPKTPADLSLNLLPSVHIATPTSKDPAEEISK